MANTIWLNICLTDIPQSKVRSGADGKQYFNCKLVERKNPKHDKPKFKETHFLAAILKKGEVLPPGEKEFIGTGGVYVDNPEEQQQPF